MPVSDAERAFLRSARVARLATADAGGRPNVVPICFALVDEAVVSAVDEKPKDAAPADLRRVRDVEANPFVAVVVDEYADDWADLAWVQVRGRAAVVTPDGDRRETRDGGDRHGDDDDRHGRAVAALRDRYDQYADHDLESRPVLWIEPGHVVSWGL